MSKYKYNIVCKYMGDDIYAVEGESLHRMGVAIDLIRY